MSNPSTDLLEAPSQVMLDLMARANTTDEKLSLLRSRYELTPIPVDHPFEQVGVYFIVGLSNAYWVKTLDPPLRDGYLHMVSMADEQALKPLRLDRLKASMEQQRVFLITSKAVDTAARDEILDMGAFSQLVEAAQRSGMVPGINTIVQVRDCEFRLGKYQQALQLMETLFSSFQSNAMQRTQRLAREDNEIASGRLKISPKDLQAKRVRDQRESGDIDRARTRFTRVVEGLRTLVQLGKSSA